MYKEYVESRFDGRFVLEFDYGFVTYNVLTENTLYIDELFIKKEHRRQGLASEINNALGEMAINLGRNIMKCSVVVGANGAEEALMTIFNNGYKLESTSGKLIFLKKELGKEGE